MSKNICSIYLLIVAHDQSDQMAKLFVQYLAIYNNENLPRGIKIVNFSRFLILSNVIQALQMAQDLMICQSEEFLPNLVTVSTMAG